MKTVILVLIFLTVNANSYFASATTYDVKKFGATGDGISNDTEAIQSAIDSCSKTGGTVVFPSGTYMTGMVQLKSNVIISLENNSIWKAIPNLDLYKVFEKSYGMPSFLFAENAHNLGIKGTGTIDGSGDAHDIFIPKPFNSTGPRPYGLLIRNCSNVSIADVSLKNAAFWMLRLQECDDVSIHGVKVYNHSNYNNDGFDITDCHNVTIADCILDCEDDAIVLKSFSVKGTRDVIVSNCIVSSHASGLKCGTESFGFFNRILFSNCIVRPSSARETLHPTQLTNGIAGIDLSITDGAHLSNVMFNNILIDGVQTPIFMRLGNRHRNYLNRVDKYTERAGKIENVTISNVRAVNVGPVSSSISGYPGSYIKNVRLSNIDIELNKSGMPSDTASVVPENSDKYPVSRMFGMNLPAYGFFIRHARNIELKNISFTIPKDEPRPAIVCDNVNDSVFEEITGSLNTPGLDLVTKFNCTNLKIEEIMVKEGGE